VLKAAYLVKEERGESEVEGGLIVGENGSCGCLPRGFHAGGGP
jgi:hypothetical protein